MAVAVAVPVAVVVQTLATNPDNLSLILRNPQDRRKNGEIDSQSCLPTYVNTQLLNDIINIQLFLKGT